MMCVNIFLHLDRAHPNDDPREVQVVRCTSEHRQREMDP